MIGELAKKNWKDCYMIFVYSDFWSRNIIWNFRRFCWLWFVYLTNLAPCIYSYKSYHFILCWRYRVGDQIYFSMCQRSSGYWCEYLRAGWICYAEKQLGSFVLPYISSVKSPQQTVGVIIKNYVCQELGLRLFINSKL